jgi:AraC-like DNA-binding protein
MGGHHDRASLNLVEGSAAGGPPPGDPLSDVLRMVKLTGALFFLLDASSPWGVEVPTAEAFAPIVLPSARHVVSYHIVIEGSGWASLSGEPSAQFVAGDVLVFPHGDAYAMLSRPGGARALPLEEALGFFRAMAAGELPFVVAEGGGGPERARFVCGFLGCDARPFNPLLATLPRFMHVRRPAGPQDDLLDRLIALTLDQARLSRPGGECIRLRLSELMFVEVVRRYLEALPAGETGWLAGLRDAGVGRALALLHQRPAQRWTLEALAAEAGISRSVLAERFTRLVGHPPMEYLARWRVQMAARLLADGAAKVSAVALDVGYASEASFSRTFKKIAGVSPAAWRANAGPHDKRAVSPKS